MSDEGGFNAGEAAMTAVGLVPGLGAGAETVRQEIDRGTNPVAIAFEAAWDTGLNLFLPGVEKALKNIEATHISDRRGKRESEEIPFGGFAFMAAADTAFSVGKIATATVVGGAFGPEAGVGTFVVLHEIQERMGLAVTGAVLQKIMRPAQA